MSSGYNGLTNKHLEALELLKSGSFTQREVAQKIGISSETLNGWINADASAGPTAALFSEQYKRIRKDQDAETLADQKVIIRSLSAKLKSWAETIIPTTTTDIRTMRGVLATLCDATKSEVDITQIFNYSNNVEDIVSEAKRLQTIADAALNRSANTSPGSRGSGPVSGKSKARNKGGKGKQKPELPPEP